MIESIITDQIDSDFETACRIISESGLKAIEIHNVFGKSIEQCSEAEAHRIREIADGYGLKTVNLATTIFFLCPLYEGYHVSLFNPEFYCIEGDVNVHLEYLEQACRTAEITGAKMIRIFPFRIPDNEDVGVVGTEKDLQAIAANIRLASAIAAEHDITLVLENCPYSHCPKAAMTQRLLRLADCRNVKLLYDPANSYRAEKRRVPEEWQTDDIPAEYHLVKNDIGHIHLKNYHYQKDLQPKPFIHTALLDGDIDYLPLLNEMKKEKPALSLEPEVSHEDALKCIRQLISAVR